MTRRLKATILAVALMAASIVPMTASAGRGGSPSGQTVRTRTVDTNRIRNRQRLRDGSCMNGAKARFGEMSKKGYTYGPGDGTGNVGSGPKDGTGYGTPSQK